jgi:DNA-binding NarL/FixJ family response regulator
MLPSQLEDASLAEAIEQTLGQLHDEDGLSTSVIVEGRIDLLPKNSQATMFRIFSEAITNVRRHARATSVVVQLIETSSDIRMSVLDNGIGMQSTEAQSSESGGFGLETMRERAESLGGRLTVSSAYDSGTEILLSVPVSRPPPKARLSPRRVVPHSVGVARVLMIDDHPTFREGIRQLLAQAPGVRLVGEAPTGAEGFAMVVSRRPDVVLLDLDLPDCSGIELARRVRSAVPEAAVIILSAFAESDNVSDALHAGARGYVAKSVGPSTILDAINTVLNGGTLLPSSFLSDSISGQESLTPRELEILKWIALGKTNAEIGRELHLAHKTIERVVANVTRKLEAQNRAHAVAKGIARKLVDVRDVRADPR